MTRLIPPTATLDADRKRELIEHLTNAVDALRVVQNALRETYPQARDYSRDLDRAVEEWVELQSTIDTIVDELLGHAMRITLG